MLGARPTCYAATPASHLLRALQPSRLVAGVFLAGLSPAVDRQGVAELTRAGICADSLLHYLDGSVGLGHRFDLSCSPGLVEEGLQRAVQAQDDEPALLRVGLDPVAGGNTVGPGRREVDDGAAIRCRTSRCGSATGGERLCRLHLRASRPPPIRLRRVERRFGLRHGHHSDWVKLTLRRTEIWLPGSLCQLPDCGSPGGRPGAIHIM